MRGTHIVESFYETKLARSLGPVSVTDTPLTVYRIYVVDEPVDNKGWLIIEYENKPNREIIYFHDRNGIELLVYKKDRWISPTIASNITHPEGASIRMHDVANLFNYFSNNTSDLGYVQKWFNETSKLAIRIKGGFIRLIGGNETTIPETTLILDASETHNIYIDITDGLIKSKTTALIITEIPLSIVVTNADDIVSITDKRSEIVYSIFSNDFFEIDGNITVLKDGSITEVKLADSSVSTAKIANGAVTSERLADGSVNTAKLSSGAVTSEKIQEDVNLTGSLLLDNLGANPSNPSTGKIKVFVKDLLGQPTPHAITPDGTVIPLGINPIVTPGSTVVVGPVTRTDGQSSTIFSDINVLVASSVVTQVVIATGTINGTVIESNITTDGSITFTSYGVDGNLSLETGIILFYHIVY